MAGRSGIRTQILSHGKAHILNYSAVFFPCPEHWDIRGKAQEMVTE